MGVALALSTEEEEVHKTSNIHGDMDTDSRDDFIRKNEGLVALVARRFMYRIGSETAMGFEDLMQIGYIGLIKAYDNFDRTYKVKFSTYAIPMIYGEIRRYLRDAGFIKVSRGIKELIAKMGKLLEDEKTDEEIADILGVTMEDIKEARQAMVSSHVQSLSLTIHEGDSTDITLEEKLASDVDVAEDSLESIIASEAITLLKNYLSPNHRKILYYFVHHIEMTQCEVAEAAGTTQVQVSRGQKKIQSMLRLIGHYFKGDITKIQMEYLFQYSNKYEFNEIWKRLTDKIPVNFSYTIEKDNEVEVQKTEKIVIDDSFKSCYTQKVRQISTRAKEEKNINVMKGEKEQMEERKMGRPANPEQEKCLKAIAGWALENIGETVEVGKILNMFDLKAVPGTESALKQKALDLLAKQNFIVGFVPRETGRGYNWFIKGKQGDKRLFARHTEVIVTDTKVGSTYPTSLQGNGNAEIHWLDEKVAEGATGTTKDETKNMGQKYTPDVLAVPGGGVVPAVTASVVEKSEALPTATVVGSVNDAMFAGYIADGRVQELEDALKTKDAELHKKDVEVLKLVDEVKDLTKDKGELEVELKAKDEHLESNARTISKLSRELVETEEKLERANDAIKALEDGCGYDCETTLIEEKAHMFSLKDENMDAETTNEMMVMINSLLKMAQKKGKNLVVSLTVDME